MHREVFFFFFLISYTRKKYAGVITFAESVPMVYWGWHKGVFIVQGMREIFHYSNLLNLLGNFNEQEACAMSSKQRNFNV